MIVASGCWHIYLIRLFRDMEKSAYGKTLAQHQQQRALKKRLWASSQTAEAKAEALLAVFQSQKSFIG